jgi:hypothetical protein
MDIVVSGGSDPDRPLPAPRDRQHLLLQVIALGVFLVAAATGYTGWTVYQQSQDTRALNCAYLTAGGEEQRDYDDMEKYEQKIVDQLDCDVPGR